LQRKEDLSRAPHGQGSSGKKKKPRDEMSLESGDELASRPAVNSSESAKRKLEITLKSSHKSTPAEKKMRNSLEKLPSHGKKPAVDPYGFDDAGSDSSAESGSQEDGRNRTPVKKSQETSSDSAGESDE